MRRPWRIVSTIDSSACAAPSSSLCTSGWSSLGRTSATPGHLWRTAAPKVGFCYRRNMWRDFQYLSFAPHQLPYSSPISIMCWQHDAVLVGIGQLLCHGDRDLFLEKSILRSSAPTLLSFAFVLWAGPQSSAGAHYTENANENKGEQPDDTEPE